MKLTAATFKIAAELPVGDKIDNFIALALKPLLGYVPYVSAGGLSLATSRLESMEQVLVHKEAVENFFKEHHLPYKMTAHGNPRSREHGSWVYQWNEDAMRKALDKNFPGWDQDPALSAHRFIRWHVRFYPSEQTEKQDYIYDSEEEAKMVLAELQEMDPEGEGDIYWTREPQNYPE